MTWLWEMTLYASITAVVILIVKALLKNKISAKWQLYVWVILLVRICIPVLPESQISIFNTLSLIPQAIPQTPGQAVAILPQVLGAPQPIPVSPALSVSEIILAVWAIVAVLLLLWFVFVYLSFTQKTTKFERCTDAKILQIYQSCKKEQSVKRNIYVLLGGNTPILKGIFKPSIVLPTGYTPNEIKDIFTHELCHYKHGDVFTIWVATLALCLNWFNPIMWYCFFTVRKDIELACDQRVLELTNSRQEYARLLVKTALRKNKFILGTTSLQNGEKEITKRVQFIAGFKKPKVYLSVIAAAIAVAVGIVCLTNGLKPSQQGDELLYKPSVESLDESDPVKTHTKLLTMWLENHVKLNQPKDCDISDYRIGQSELVLAADEYCVFVSDYDVKGSNPEKFTLASGTFAATPDGWLKYANVYSVVALENSKATFVGFLSASTLNEKGIEWSARDLYNGLVGKPTTSDIIEAMYDLKTPFVGDNSAVGNIIASLPFTPHLQSNGFELVTNAQPYKIKVSFDVTSTTQDESLDLENNTRKNAFLMFSLIDNVDEVDMNVNNQLQFHFTRSEADAEYGQSIRNFTQKKTDFENFFNALAQMQFYSPMTPTYSLSKLGKNGESAVITKLSDDTAQLVRDAIMNYMVKSSTVPAIDLSTLTEYYCITAQYDHLDPSANYYLFEKNGEAFMQYGTRYATINVELYEQLAAFVNTKLATGSSSFTG